MAANAIDVKAAIVSLIKGLPEATAEKWDTDWGYTKTPERTWVYVGEVNWDESHWVTNRTREELFKVKVAISVKRRLKTPEECEREVLRIASLIEMAVKADISLGVDAVKASDFTPRRMDSWPVDEFCEAQYEADIFVTARF